MQGVIATYRRLFISAAVNINGKNKLLIFLLSAFLLLTASASICAQDKTHSKKLEKTKIKKERRKKDKKAAQFQGKIEPSATPTIKGNPTKKSKKTSGSRYQERIGVGKIPRGTKGTDFSGKRKAKNIEKSKGTRYRGDAVSTESKVVGNPTRKKRASGAQYQERIGADSPPRGTKGTRFSGRSKIKSIKDSKGTNYRGDKIPLETNRIKGNPTRNSGKNAQNYQERTGNQGPPSGTPGTNFSGKRRPKKIDTGGEGTTYRGQSTAGSSSTAGGRPTIYGERGRNNQKNGVPEIKQRDQGTNWKGNIKGQNYQEGTPGTGFKGHLKAGKRQILDYGGDWSGDQKVKKKAIKDYGGDWAGDLKLKFRKPNTKASTYTIKGHRAKELSQAPGTTFKGHLDKPKKIVNWDGADFSGDLRVNPNKKTRTEGTKFAGHLKVRPNAKTKTEGMDFAGNLRVRPNAKTKTEGMDFAGHYKVRPNAKVKTEGLDFRGNNKVATRFFKNRYLRKKSQEEQLFAGNYKIRRNKGKDMHPSATYQGGPLKRTKSGDELSRKWKLFWAKTKKNADQPKHLKDKGKKPKYDPKEREIWND